MLRCGRLASDQQRTKNYPACTYQDLLSRDECFAGRVRYQFTGREWPIRTDCSRKDIVGELADVELAASTGLRHGGLAETASSKEIGRCRCESGAALANATSCPTASCVWWSKGIAYPRCRSVPREPVTATLSPMSRPSESSSGPPLKPGSSLTVVSTRSP